MALTLLRQQTLSSITPRSHSDNPLEMLATSKKLNHNALKTKLYLSALQQAFKELQLLQPLKFSELVTA
jgi:hypothetical protein